MTAQFNDADAPERTDDRIRQHLNLARKCWRRAPIFLEDSNFRRACGQGWGAVTMLTKAVASRRGLPHDRPDYIRDVIVDLCRELTDRERTNEIYRALRAAEALYGKFYEVSMDARLARSTLDATLPLMEFLWEQLPVAYTAGASFDEFCQLLGSDYDLKDQEYRRSADGRAVLRNRRDWDACVKRMGVAEAQMSHDAYLVAQGVRALALVAVIPNDPSFMVDAYNVLATIGNGVYPGACRPAMPFVLPLLGEDVADAGYASHSWVIDTYEWIVGNVPKPHLARLLGLLLGYSSDAVAAYDDRPTGARYVDWDVPGA